MEFISFLRKLISVTYVPWEFQTPVAFIMVSTVLLFSEEVCRTRGYGAYAHPHDCHGYIVCTSLGPGTPTMTHAELCSDGLVFNELLRSCDLDVEGRCYTPSTLTSSGSTGECMLMLITYLPASHRNHLHHWQRAVCSCEAAVVCVRVRVCAIPINLTRLLVLI